MRKLFKTANRYLFVLGDDAPETVRAPFSYEDIEQERFPQSSSKNLSDKVSIILNKEELTNLHFAMSALLAEPKLLAYLMQSYGKNIRAAIEQINGYASQARIELDNKGNPNRIASAAHMMMLTLAAIEYEEYEEMDEPPPETVRNPGVSREYIPSMAPTQRTPRIWEEEASDEYPQVKVTIPPPPSSPRPSHDEFAPTLRRYVHPEDEKVSLEFTPAEFSMLSMALLELEQSWKQEGKENSDLKLIRDLIKRLES